MKQLGFIVSRLHALLLRWASGGTWLAIAALAVVAVWGWIDPFALRQRLDWLVADQFLRYRTPPPLHKDILQVAVDDRAAESIEFPIPRHQYARALRQLQRLGAATVMMDLVFVDPKSDIALAEADRRLVPRAAVVEDELLGQRFSEDHILANAIAETDHIALAYYLPVPFRAPAADDALVAAMADRLAADLSQSADPLAAQLGIDPARGRELFDAALREALRRVARQVIAAAESDDADPLLADAMQTRNLPAGYAPRFIRAVGQARAERELAKSSAAGDADRLSHVPAVAPHDEPKLPVYAFTAACDALGFADAAPDADGRIRRLPLVKRWNDRYLMHLGLAAALLHSGADPHDLQLDARELALPARSLHIPLDALGQMVINWPMNAQHPWDAVIAQISLADLIELDRYEYDLSASRHQLRAQYARLEQLAPTGDEWHRSFQSIEQALAAGDVVRAERYAARFDADAIPRIAAQPDAAQAFHRARQADAVPLAADDLAAQQAFEILSLGERIGAMEQEYLAVSSETRRRVAGKLCLIGDTTVGSSDLRQTPVAAEVPGVAIIAAAISTILSGNHARVMGYPVSALCMLLIAGGLLYPFLRLRPLGAGAVGSISMLGTLYGSFAVLAAADTFVSPVTPALGLLVVYMVTTTYHWLSEYRQKKLVRTIFEAQTNPTIVQRLIEAGRAGVAEVLAPKNRQVTVFFAELADFETLAQQIVPEKLPDLLGRIFGTMNKIILGHEGTLDRYQGHAMVAFFGAPVYQPDHAERACHAALECRDTLRQLEPAWTERQLPVPRVHVGLHTGELLVGNITLTSRVDYTVAGDNLNVAYRIGELNETYGTQIMLSEATVVRCENLFEARELDLVRIKGRREPIRAFELMAAKGKLSSDRSQLRGAFATGLVAFRNRDFVSALSMFRSCRETAPGDRAATVYIERCEKELSATANAERL